MKNQKIMRIATRKSPLALWQANHVAKILKQYWPQMTIELLPIVSSGDKFLDNSVAEHGGKGLFVKELEEALFNKKADIAVHSMKDVPSFFPEGLILAAICKRDNPLDALITRGNINLHALPKDSIIGTASLRRQAQLLAIRPDLKIKSLRGNINTRVEKFKDGQYDAIILAAAGLERMQMTSSITEILSEDLMLPSCGQGALGVECREDDEVVQNFIAPLNDPISALCIHNERRVNTLLGGSCKLPLAVFCTLLDSQTLLIRAKILTPDGKTVIADRQEGPLIADLRIADNCAKSLLLQGGERILEQASRSA